MKRFVMTAVLACALSVPAFAGEMPTGGIAAPPPPHPGDGFSASSSSLGKIPNVDCVEEISGSALSALLSVLALVAV